MPVTIILQGIIYCFAGFAPYLSIHLQVDHDVIGVLGPPDFTSFCMPNGLKWATKTSDVLQITRGTKI